MVYAVHMTLSPIDKTSVVMSGHLIERVGPGRYWIYTPDGRPLCAAGSVEVAVRIVQNREKP